MNNFIKLGQFKSNGRLVSEPINKFRTPFQRDRDRIIHSEAFRRLKHKTQVFVNTDGDHFRTRITHSIEVSQIARTISKYLHLNEELTETLSLAHDLGHTPFGHAGEMWKPLPTCFKHPCLRTYTQIVFMHAHVYIYIYVCVCVCTFHNCPITLLSHELHHVWSHHACRHTSMHSSLAATSQHCNRPTCLLRRPCNVCDDCPLAPHVCESQTL